MISSGPSLVLGARNEGGARGIDHGRGRQVVIRAVADAVGGLFEETLALVALSIRGSVRHLSRLTHCDRGCFRCRVRGIRSQTSPAHSERRSASASTDTSSYVSTNVSSPRWTVRTIEPGTPWSISITSPSAIGVGERNTPAMVRDPPVDIVDVHHQKKKGHCDRSVLNRRNTVE